MILNSPTISGSLTVTGNIIASGSITLSGSVASASYAATASFVALAQSASNAVAAATASSADNLLVRNTLTAQTLVVQTVTSSVIYSSGSNIFGNASSNTQTFTGSVLMSGSLDVNSGSLFVTGSSVGVNTNSPQSQFVVAAKTGNSASVEINLNNAGYGRIFAYNRSTATTASLILNDPGGNVGIGTTTPSASLDVASTARFFSAGNWMQFETNVLTSLNNDGAHIRSVISADVAPTYAWKGDTDTGMYTPGANTIAFSTAGINRLNITSAGVLDLPYGQIKFPTTQITSSDANTLDDYKEGTWTPTINGSTGNPSVTYASANTGGLYTKIGNVVTISFEIRWSSLSGGSGAATISGLPFTRRSTNQPDGDRFIVDSYNNTINGLYLIGSIGSGGTGIGLSIVRSAATTTDLLVSNLGTINPTFLRGTATYFV